MSAEFDPEELLHLLLISPSELNQHEDIPPFLKRMIEEIHETFLFNLNLDRRVIGATYVYGALVGAYISGRDPKIVEEAERLVTKVRQSQRGKRSGEARKSRPWRAHVEKIAKQIVQKSKVKLSCAAIAKAVVDQWDYADGGLPSQRTLETLIANLDRDGKLPR